MIGAGDDAQSTPMGMPEAAVYKDHRPVLREHDVGFPWQILDVKSVAVAEGVKGAPDAHLDAGVLASNAGHVAASLRFGHHVGHL